MTREEFATSMETAASHLGHPMDDETKALLRRLLDRYEEEWTAEGRPGLMSRVRLAVLRAVMYSRAKDTHMTASAFMLACGEARLKPPRPG